MNRFLAFIILSLASSQVVLAVFEAPRSRPPSPILPGQYRAAEPKDALNKHKPDVYITRPGHGGNKIAHPTVILEGANAQGVIKAAVITHNPQKAIENSTPIQDMDRKTRVDGYVSLKKPMEFKSEHFQGKYQKPIGRPVRDMSPTSLNKLKNAIVANNAGFAFKEAGARRRSQSPQASGSGSRPIAPLPRRRTPPAPPGSPPRIPPPPPGSPPKTPPPPPGTPPRIPPPPPGTPPRTPPPPPPSRGTKRKNSSPPPPPPPRGGGSKGKGRSPPPGKKQRLSRRDLIMYILNEELAY